MSEEKKGTEEENKDIILERKSEHEITKDDLAEFDRFVSEEIGSFEAVKDRNSDEFAQTGTAAYVHTLAWLELKRRVEANKGVSAIFARDRGELIGYSIVFVERDTNSASNTFLGVRSNYQRRGIGTILIQARHESLQSLGISSYETNARESVLRLYDKLGVHYAIHSQLSGTIGYQVTVYLQNP